MNFSSPTPSSSSTPRGPSSHHEFFAKLYGSFEDKKDDQTSKRSLIDLDVADDDDDADIDVDVESDSDVSTNDGNSSSTKNETSPTQKLSPTLPPISHPTPGKKFSHKCFKILDPD